MFSRLVASETIGGNFKLASPISIKISIRIYIYNKSLSKEINLPEGHKTKNPQQNPNSLGADVLDSSDVYGLTIVTQPVAKVHALNVELREFASTSGAGHSQGEEDIFDVTMAPVLTFDLGERGNVSGSERVGGTGKEEEGKDGSEEEGLRRGPRHFDIVKREYLS